ncbi:YggU family protein [Candidatus Peregrinibacteria bacterium]|nr:YggU family protein [Candidatus Peregrinibacteria bacterium]
MNNYFIQISALLKAKSLLYIRVKVLPKSPKNEIAEIMEDGTYKIRVAAPAEKGKANAELCKFLKKTLGAEASIVSGQTDRMKLVRLAIQSRTQH